MQKINLLLFILLLIILIIISFVKIQKNDSFNNLEKKENYSNISNQGYSKNIIVSTNPNSKISQKKIETTVLEKIQAEKKKLTLLHLKSKNEIKINEKDVNKKDKQYLTTEDVMNKLFPNLKERYGEEEYDLFISKFPFFYMQLNPTNMTDYQKKEFMRMKLEMRKLREISIPDNLYTQEEMFKITNEINRMYISDFMNLFTEQQQKEFAEAVEEQFLVLNVTKKDSK